MDNVSFEKLGEGLTICASSKHRFGTDAFLLANFANHRRKDTVCDLGTGCGIIPLLMSRNSPPAKVYAVDIQAEAIEQLKLSLSHSTVPLNITPIVADLKELWENAPLGELDIVTCNPPYKALNAGIATEMTAQRIARHEILCTINDVCFAAKKLLKFGGKLCLCNRPERLSDVIVAMKSNNIEPKVIRFISKTAKDAPWLFLIEGKKGSKPFMKVLPHMYIKDENCKGFSDELLQIYKGVDNGR